MHSPLRDCQPVHQHFATKPLHAYSLVPRPFPTRPWRRSHAVMSSRQEVVPDRCNSQSLH